MAFDVPTFVRTIHIIAATLWVGGAVLMAFVLGPSLRAAGPAAGPFMMTVLRRGGLSPYFLSLGGIVILAGGYLYGEYGYGEDPFGTGGRMVITIGALSAVLAYIHGLAILMPNERKMKALVRSMAPGTPPTAAQVTEMQERGQKQGVQSALSALLLLLSLILMTISRLF
jgi:uncharacterized membrane protein